jgi:penicillin V acylase-like amidase (Ntn superfamily)
MADAETYRETADKIMAELEYITKCHTLLDGINLPPGTGATRAEQLYNRIASYIEMRQDIA